MTIRITRMKVILAVLVAALLIPATALATDVFTDVDDGKFYAGPVEWAFDNGITTGKSSTIFAPGDAVTRGESVTFLKRYQDKVVQPALDANTAAIADQAGKFHWAVVTSDGTLDRASTGAISSWRTSAGNYRVGFGFDLSQCSFVAGLSNPLSGLPTDGIVVSAVLVAEVETLFIATENFSNARIDNNFHVQVMC